MSVFARGRDCTCPGTPHDEGDGVYLRPSLTLAGGLAAEHALYDASRLYPLADNAPADEQERVVAQRTAYIRPTWFELFLRHGAEGWNLVSEDGPIPLDLDALLADYAFARPIAEAANDLYGEAVLAPLVGLQPKPSRNGRTGDGTHPSPARTPRRSKASSPDTSAGTASWTA